MALANAACWLIQSATTVTPRVLMMDWDLEAPGLHRYFESRSERPEDFERPGVIDYFIALRNGLDGQSTLYESVCSEEGAQVLREQFPLDAYVIPNVFPNVDLIKAGKLDAAYAENVSTFGWVDFHKSYGEILEPFREMLAGAYDYILVDSRTGFNDVSGVCTMLIPETLVVVFTPNRQSLSGVIDLATRATNYRRGSNDFRPLSVFPLPSRIENAELELKRDWRRRYQQEFEGALKGIYQLEKCDLTNYFDEVQLPQVAYYAYGEKIALLEERSDSLSLGRAYEVFFKKLIGLNFAWDAPVKEAEVEAAPLPTLNETDTAATDVYISYSHIDNASLGEGKRGWVDTFQETLSIRLAQLIGRPVNIFYDPKLQGNDAIADTLALTMMKASVFITILSPRYVKSQWSARELATLSEISNTTGSAEQRRSVFKVVKTPVPMDQQPAELRDYVGYEFFETDESLGRPREFRPDEQYAQESKYWAKLDDLAWDIKEALEGNQHEASAPGSSRIGVYLAETTSDLSVERDNIKRELQQHRLLVFPDKPLPFMANELEEEVRAYLRRCSISVHLIGGRYGITPEDDSRSIVAFQVQLAAERAEDLELKQLVWIPREAMPTDERQQAFVDGLLNGTLVARNAEVLQTTLGDLKDYILATSVQRERPAVKAPDQLLRIYIVVDQADIDRVRALEDYLFGCGYEVLLPLFEGDESALREDHKENLMVCDAVLIFQGSSNEMWLRTKLRDLQKLAGYGRKRILAKAIYMAASQTGGSEHFRTHEAKVLREFGAFDPSVLEPFLDDLTAAKAESEPAQGK